MELKFYNEAELDFSLEENHSKLMAAYKVMDAKKGEQIPLVINGERIKTESTINSVNPAKKAEVIAKVSVASVEQADAAILSCKEAFKTWSRTSVEERVEKVLKLNDLLKEYRYELIALMTEENGKNWGEADGELCELLDFNLAYACAALELEAGITYLESCDTEKRKCDYIPIGVGIAIAPWNFPLSLIGGMVSAALITGNTIVMKPASDTPTVAYKFFELVEKAGFPAGTVNFVTGAGGAIGDYLVEHKDTRFINFTGSKAVGIRINELAAKVNPDQIWMKRIVAEMGGKNAIVVDESADIEKAVEGVVNSAFTLQGQKCSACSRVLVHENVEDEFIEKLLVAVKGLKRGLGRDNGEVGPVISASAFKGIVKYIEHSKENDKLLIGGDYDDSEGYFISPTVFKVNENSRIAREEVFGPVLGVMSFTDFEKAIEIVNSTEYALTGSLYSQTEEHIEYAWENFHVGNFYVNRKSTGAVVHQHPFGGFNMSGTDAKTGTTDYLQNFLQLKARTRVY